MKVGEELEKGLLLGFSSSVFGMTLRVETTDIADADAVSIVVFDVSTFLFQRSAGMDAAVLVDDVVVADAIPISGSVPAVNVGNCHFLIGFCRGTVDYYEAYLAHGGSGGFMVNGL